MKSNIDLLINPSETKKKNVQTISFVLTYIVRGWNESSQICMNSDSFSEAEVMEQIYHVGSQQRQRSSAHSGVTQPGVLSFQHTFTNYPRIYFLSSILPQTILEYAFFQAYFHKLSQNILSFKHTSTNYPRVYFLSSILLQTILEYTFFQLPQTITEYTFFQAYFHKPS